MFSHLFGILNIFKQEKEKNKKITWKKMTPVRISIEDMEIDEKMKMLRWKCPCGIPMDISLEDLENKIPEGKLKVFFSNNILY